MLEGKMGFVEGEDRFGAKPPEGLPFRFAVLTWFDLEGEPDDPWELARAALPRVAAAVGADSITAEYWDRRKKGLILQRVEEKLTFEIPWDELVGPAGPGPEEREFPHRLRFEGGGEVLMREETEFWNLVGGPPPYSDSVTLSFFTPVERAEELKTIFSEAAVALGLGSP